MNPSEITELALRLPWTGRLELAQRLLESLHHRDTVELPDPFAPQLSPSLIGMDAIAESFRKLREALENSLE